MKAEINYRIHKENHVKLGDVVPLEMPFVLVVDPINLCNLKCKFCPTGNLPLIKSTGRYQGMIDIYLFEKVINDLAEFSQPLRVLRLYKEGEPLLNPLFAQMVNTAKNSGLVKRVDTTTNGVMLSPLLNRKLIDAGLDQINISVNGINAEQVYYYTRTKIDFNRYVENIRDLYENRGQCLVSVKSIKEILSEDDRKHFFDIFGNIADRIVLENLSPAWPQFKFHNDVPMHFESGNYGQDIIDRKICPYIFYMMVINASGKVSTCIGDWPNKQIVGDVRISSLREIWNGRLLNGYRINHLIGKRANSEFCGSCEVVSHGTVDNLDEYADKIYQRMGQI